MEKEALWHLMVEAKYDSMSGGQCFKEVEGAFELECENILGGGGESFSNLSGMKWQIDLRLGSDMVYDAGSTAEGIFSEIV